MSEVEQTPPAPDLHVGPAPTTPQAISTPVLSPEGHWEAKVETGAGSSTSLLDLARITGVFKYLRVTTVVTTLLQLVDVPVGTIEGDERIVSILSFDDMPLRYCLEHLAHMVSGSWSQDDAGAVSFKAGS